MTSFLQDHYNRYIESGGSHAKYVAWNELDKDTAQKLKETYWKTTLKDKATKNPATRRPKYMGPPDLVCKCGHVRISFKKVKPDIPSLYIRHPHLLETGTPGGVSMQAMISS